MVSRNNDDGGLRPEDSTKAKEIFAIEPGHAPVRNNGIEHIAEHVFQRFIPVPRKMNLVLCLFK